jgi:hypothetical protein
MLRADGASGESRNQAVTGPQRGTRRAHRPGARATQRPENLLVAPRREVSPRISAPHLRPQGGVPIVAHETELDRISVPRLHHRARQDEAAHRLVPALGKRTDRARRVHRGRLVPSGRPFEIRTTPRGRTPSFVECPLVVAAERAEARVRATRAEVGLSERALESVADRRLREEPPPGDGRRRPCGRWAAGTALEGGQPLAESRQAVGQTVAECAGGVRPRTPSRGPVHLELSSPWRVVRADDTASVG